MYIHIHVNIYVHVVPILFVLVGFDVLKSCGNYVPNFFLNACKRNVMSVYHLCLLPAYYTCKLTESFFNLLHRIFFFYLKITLISVINCGSHTF